MTQLSYTFRSRRHSTPLVKKHYHALKALAIRKHKIHILGSPDLNESGTPVCFDVEGGADGDFYYLIGMRTGTVALDVVIGRCCSCGGLIPKWLGVYERELSKCIEETAKRSVLNN